MIAGKFSRDVDLCHRRRWPGRAPNRLSRLWLIATSRGLWALFAHRMMHSWINQRRDSVHAKLVHELLRIPLSTLMWFIKITGKFDILARSELEGGVSFADGGFVIFGARKMGAGSVIGSRTTIGIGLVDGGHPEIGRNVWIGDDCVVHGRVTIGDGATLLPGTVLTKSIPSGVVMQGNPARLVLRDFDNRALREHGTANVARLVAEVGEH